MNKEKFDKLLSRHKKWIVKLAELPREELEKPENQHIPMIVKEQCRELALVNADFKCQRCGASDNLSYHHLLMRKAKEFIPFGQYISQRNYWANMAILCLDCHGQYHKTVDNNGEGHLPNPGNSIPAEQINKLKEKWSFKDKPKDLNTPISLTDHVGNTIQLK